MMGNFECVAIFAILTAHLHGFHFIPSDWHMTITFCKMQIYTEVVCGAPTHSPHSFLSNSTCPNDVSSFFSNFLVLVDTFYSVRSPHLWPSLWYVNAPFLFIPIPSVCLLWCLGTERVNWYYVDFAHIRHFKNTNSDTLHISWIQITLPSRFTTALIDRIFS